MNASLGLSLRRASRPLRRALARLGPVSAAGIALVLIGALALLELEQEMAASPVPTVATVDAVLRTDRMPRASERAPEVAGSAARANPLTAPDEVHAAVLRLFAAAQGLQIDLPEGDYRLAASPDARFQTYTITLPVKGSYGALRAFLAASLRQDERLALDSLEFRRDQIGVDALDARVRFSLFVGQP